jgi:hypothetical protein
LSPGEDVDHEQPSQPLHHPQPTHPPQPLHQHTVSNASTATVDIEAWTVAALESLSIAPIARGTGNTLSIPLDGSHRNQGKPAENDDHAGDDVTSRMRLRGVAFGETTDGDDAGYGAGITPPRRLPSRRDSMRRREALLKGKEGSRQRRRWENGWFSSPLHPIPSRPIPFLSHSIQYPDQTPFSFPPYLPESRLYKVP